MSRDKRAIEVIALLTDDPRHLVRRQVNVTPDQSWSQCSNPEEVSEQPNVIVYDRSTFTLCIALGILFGVLTRLSYHFSIFFILQHPDSHELANML